MTSWRVRLQRSLFSAETTSARWVDLLILVMTLASILTVMLASVDDLRQRYEPVFVVLEWMFTAFFTIDYALRLVTAPMPTRYAFSFFGLVDAIAVLPAYLSLTLPGLESLLVLRALQLLRVFRLLKLIRFVQEADQLWQSLSASASKITVFLTGVFVLQLVIASFMYLIEGPSHGFDSIPHSLYWTIVTMTTVGYGDLTPQTATGKVLASIIMLIGYGIIAVPTGIVTSDLTRRRSSQSEECQTCGHREIPEGAKYCPACGVSLAGRSS